MADRNMWWQKSVFYQIYPRSFADGDGDGIGDFLGMISKLDYLKKLGVDAIWLSPHYPSPQVDCGYDISDYCAVAPEYGTMDYFLAFLDGLHERGMYLITDFVINHTSHKHSWFLESASSQNNPKHDWYIWKDPVNGGPPNDWQSIFGGSAWEYSPQRKQYYYHYFFKEQPDLNWRNPAVKQAMFDVMRFWLDKGVDGFRIDAIDAVFEDEDMPESGPLLSAKQYADFFGAHAGYDDKISAINSMWKKLRYQHCQPELHQLLKELRLVVDEFPGDRVLAGETDHPQYYGENNDELHLLFNTPLMLSPSLNAVSVRCNQNERLNQLPNGAWPCNTLNNHDSTRICTRYGNGDVDGWGNRVALFVMLTLKGTPFLYNGEEIGMTDLILDSPDRFRDSLSSWLYELNVNQLGAPEHEAFLNAAFTGRDRCRTPLQWDYSPNAGFCPSEITPWLPVNPDYSKGINIKIQDHDPDSLLNFYRLLLSLRKQNGALNIGDYKDLPQAGESCSLFIRETNNQRCLVAINWTEYQQMVQPSNIEELSCLYSSSTHRSKEYIENGNSICLHPHELYIGNC